jgi:hypothetical protein
VKTRQTPNDESNFRKGTRSSRGMIQQSRRDASLFVDNIAITLLTSPLRRTTRSTLLPDGGGGGGGGGGGKRGGGGRGERVRAVREIWHPIAREAQTVSGMHGIGIAGGPLGRPCRTFPDSISSLGGRERGEGERGTGRRGGGWRFSWHIAASRRVPARCHPVRVSSSSFRIRRR